MDTDQCKTITCQAWDLYYHVFRRIDKQLQTLTTLDLQARAEPFCAYNFFYVVSNGKYFVWETSLFLQSYWNAKNWSWLFLEHIELVKLKCYLERIGVLSFSFCHCIMVTSCQSVTSDSPVVTIASFADQLVVITSKQRPRKLTIHGSDGKDYAFLLKGHEDLRQDERVMQVLKCFKVFVPLIHSNVLVQVIWFL